MLPTQHSPSADTAPISTTTDMSAQVETTSTEPQAFELTGPMSVLAGTKTVVTYRSGIKLELSPGQHVILSAKTPSTLFSPIAMQMEPVE
jgi:hypothetical protein